MKDDIKDFVRDVKDGFNELPKVMSIIIVICLITWEFHGFGSAFYAFLYLFGVWAIIYIIFPLITLFLGTINYIFGLESDKNTKNK